MRGMERAGVGRWQKRGHWVWPLVLMLVVTYISGTPGPQLGPAQFAGVDKVGHFVVFGLIGLSWVRCFWGWGGLGVWGRWGLAVALTAGFGLGDELHQLTNPERYFEWYDLLADVMGAMVCAGLYAWVGWIRKLLEWPVARVWRRE